MPSSIYIVLRVERTFLSDFFKLLRLLGFRSRKKLKIRKIIGFQKKSQDSRISEDKG